MGFCFYHGGTRGFWTKWVMGSKVQKAENHWLSLLALARDMLPEEFLSQSSQPKQSLNSKQENKPLWSVAGTQWGSPLALASSTAAPSCSRLFYSQLSPSLQTVHSQSPFLLSSLGSLSAAPSQVQIFNRAGCPLLR